MKTHVKPAFLSGFTTVFFSVPLFLIAVMLFISGLTLHPAPAAAQPSPAELADRFDRVNMERIARIDQIRITNRITSGMFEGRETSTMFVKAERNGKYILEPVDENQLHDADELGGLADDLFSEMIRNASRIEHDTFEGHRVYKITVDDSEFLGKMGLVGAMDAFDELDSALDELEDPLYERFDDEFSPESFILWLDRDELLMRFAEFDRNSDGVTICYRFSDYQNFSGLPIPMVMEIEVKGLEDLVSDEELAEARESLREMEAQLEQMPESQREMIRQHLKPQMERFEILLESGDLGRSRVEVVDVAVN